MEPIYQEPPSQLVAEEISEPKSVGFENARSLAPMQSRKRQGAGRNLWGTPKQAPELEMQYLVERRGSLLWVGTRRNVPVKHVTATAGWIGTGAGNSSPRCLVDFSRVFTSSFLKEGGQTEKKNKDMKLESKHSRVQAATGPGKFILCFNQCPGRSSKLNA